jgi:hypothetical protein
LNLPRCVNDFLPKCLSTVESRKFLENEYSIASLKELIEVITNCVNNEYSSKTISRITQQMMLAVSTGAYLNETQLDLLEFDKISSISILNPFGKKKKNYFEF